MITMFGVPLRDLIPWRRIKGRRSPFLKPTPFNTGTPPRRRRPKDEPVQQAHPMVAALVNYEFVEERDRIDRLTRRQRRAEGLGRKYPRGKEVTAAYYEEAPIDPKVWDELAEILGDDGFAVDLRDPAHLHDTIKRSIGE